MPYTQDTMVSEPPLLQPRGGREELRAALLRPGLLHLREGHGEAAVSGALFRAGLQASEIGHDSSWISLSCARQVLEAIIAEAGEDAVGKRGRFATNPEVLGTYMRLLRQAEWPRAGYEYLASASAESTRVGRYSVRELGDARATLRYTPLEEFDQEQRERCFCLLRRAELCALPRLWGLAEARLEEPSCLCRGDPYCEYVLRWAMPSAHLATASVGAAVVAGAATGALSGNWQAAALAAAAGGGLGGGGAWLSLRARRAEVERARERHRIVALEHGLEQRGQFSAAAGDLTHTVLAGKYRILRSVGSGGIGTVYAAEHLGLGFQVAVKVLRGAAAADASEVARLRREARIQMSLEHPNIVRTFDLDQLPDGTLYVVMELLQGVSLQDQLRRRSPLPPGFVIPIYLQACRALAAAHRLGIVHRDLKPGNIFLSEGGTVKVLDFGMSKLAAEDSLTQDGYTLGTPEYMSPEQCAGGAIDARSDLYAFGVLMYESLTGDIPFQSKDRKALLDHHQRSAPRSMRKQRPDLDIPEELDEIVLACLAKSPADRPESAEQLERMLASVPPARVRHVYPKSTPRRLPRGGLDRGQE
jgi:serine/threonine-protein kinase